MEYHNRKNIRLENYDYSENGAYFLTLCTKDRKCLFWKNMDTYRISDGKDDSGVGAAFGGSHEKIHLSVYGKIVKNELKRIPEIYPDIVFIPKYVIMPDHLHMIFVINMYIEDNEKSGPPKAAPTVGSVINKFKGKTTKTAGFKLWQKGFYDHIIRSEKEMTEIFEYIENNPVNWANNIFNQNLWR